MVAIGLGGLHPRLAATVLLHAARKGQAVCGAVPAARQLAHARDPLGASSVVESSEATVHLFGPGDHHRLALSRGDHVLTVLPLDVIPTLTAGVWPVVHLDDNVRDGWWVAEHDVIDAILHLAQVPFSTGTVVMSGRRLWQASELVQEASMLHRRWSAGLDGAFSVDVLAEPQRPPVRVQTILSGESEPDLRPLHELLLAQRAEGWRPQMTVREALMHHLALNEGLNRA
ncbi:MAG: hypothetical protein ACPHK3_05750 [Candidatus Poseidoniaceae archaeon]